MKSLVFYQNGGGSRRVVKNQTSILGSKMGLKWLKNGKKQQSFIFLVKKTKPGVGGGVGVKDQFFYVFFGPPFPFGI